MKKVPQIILLLALIVSVASVCACPRRTMTPEGFRRGERGMISGAIQALMVDKGLSDLSKYADGTPTGAPVRSYNAGTATNDMASFPSAVWHIYYDGKEGYVRVRMTEYYYTVENDGTVRQFADAAKTVEYEYQERQLTPEEQRAMEKVTVEKGVLTLMMIEELTDLSRYADGTPTGAPMKSYAAGDATNDMRVFPSTVWHLYRDADEGTSMFFELATTEYYYTVENDGTVRQFGDPAKTVEYGAE